MNNSTSPQQLQLIRQCTAAALNIAASADNGGNCGSDFPELEDLLEECCDNLCNSAAEPSEISDSGCIEDLDVFNNSPDTLVPVPDLFLNPPDATPADCGEANGNGFVNPGRFLGGSGPSGLQAAQKAAKKAANVAKKAAKQAAQAEKKAAKQAAKAAKKAAAAAKKAAKKSGQ